MAATSSEAKDGKSFYGFLFAKAKPIPVPTPIFDALLRAIAQHIASELGDKTDAHLTPAKLAAFYKTAGHDWDSFFVDMPHAGISTVYQGLGCQHSLLPGDDDFAAPSIPALTTKGFVRWQAIQTLLEPQIQVPVLQYAAANWALKHPDTGTPLPADLPQEAFPADVDSDTDRWYQECAQRARSKLAAEEEAEAPKETAQPEFAERKVPYTHVRVNPASPRDYFASRPVNVAYVRIPSPRHTPTGRSPERERERAREREHFVRRPTASQEDPAPRRRSFSDYPHSPQDARPARVTRLVPDREPHRRRHSQPRRYSSTSSGSDDPAISPRSTPRHTGRSNEPPPISIRRVYTNSSEDSPRVVRTTAGPSPVPPSHMHSSRSSDAGRTPSYDDGKWHSTLSDIKEKITSFISPADRARSVSSSRGRRERPPRSAGVSREDVLPNSRLSRSWSEIDTDDTDLEEERRRRSRRQSSELKDYHRREKERERERDRDRDRIYRDRERERERERERDRPSLRERDRAHSESDRHRLAERRDAARDIRDRAERLVPSPSPAASAAASALNRDAGPGTPLSGAAAAARRRVNSDDDYDHLSSSRRGLYSTGSVVDGGGGGGGSGGYTRRTSSHTDLDRLDGTRRRAEWDSIRVDRGRDRDRERELMMRERERERDRDRERIRLESRERERERERERFRDDSSGGGGGERWLREGERLPRERNRDRDRDRDRDRERERERMPSPAMSASGVTGVGGRKYPETMPWDH
ncbi:hypothetical protein MYCTH_2294300 [Thermothelomyces thermophilus ATCC 42464]|uniref:DUF7514 domain-containing protein n=1 Tax=Thermothelomyces thermophilus (strain ATCC 42464 / BCRC 31852 / DSM 1799) TaxID=573729 RepID=G2Q0T6_THET4|nr:uncharacterized protein MYCTH_2294300 [Thermothelomyces thermophilus ATCC 42464]AEO53236.1 hypothetical protein MYCTH_2294300 [Thermothelomyces thermophilus ATCC 42464]